MKEVEIRSHFSGWHKVDREQAKQYVRQLMKGMPAITKEKKEAYIEEHYLRGIKVKELLF